MKHSYLSKVMTMGSSRKKIQTGKELTIILVWKSLAMEFSDLLSLLGNLEKTKLHPWRSYKIGAVYTHWKFQGQKLGNSAWFFLDHLWKFHFFTWLLEFPYALSSIPLPLEIPWPQPTLFGIFLGRAEVAWKYYFVEINFFFQRVKQSFQEHIKNVFLSTS